MNPEVIKTESVEYAYKGESYRSLDKVDLTIRKGVKTVILGANGAGKSTLFYTFNGVIKPDEGKVLVNGDPISYRRKGLRALRSKISVVLQGPDDQVFGQTVHNDAAYGPLNLGLPLDEANARADEALRMVGLTEFAKNNPFQLSYGQRKRLAIAGALAMRPEVMIMDEPTAGLDAPIASDLMELAEILHASGTTVVISTHDVDLAYAWADEIHVICEGKAVFSGNPDEFFGNSQKVFDASLSLPTYFSLNGSLSKARGVPISPYPKTESQMLIKFSSEKRGTLTICTSDNVPESACTGVYGPAARQTHPEAYYVSEGFDSCVRRVLTGEDAVLFCTPENQKVVDAKLEELSKFGDMFEVRHVRSE